MAGADLRPAFSDAQQAFGIPAVVTIPGGTPIDTEVIWVPPLPNDVPVGFDVQRQESRLIVSIPIVDVPTVPKGTVIDCADVLGGPSKTWVVDGFDRYEFDAIRVVVVES